MSWISYIFPQTLVRRSSRYNLDIRVVEERGKLKLLVNGSRQSGEYIRFLWQRAMDTFGINPSDGVERILVLGVGGGTVIGILSQLFPAAYIEAVDIDQIVLDIANQYFGLNNWPKLKLYCREAQAFVLNAREKRQRYDVIVCDLFVGRHVPEFVLNTEFLTNIHQLLPQKGRLFINYLRELEYGARSTTLESQLRKIFVSVQDASIAYNRFFLASK